MTIDALTQANEIKAEIDSLESGLEKDSETVAAFFDKWATEHKDITLYIWDDCSKKGLHINFHGDAFDFMREIVEKQKTGQEQKLKGLKEQLAAL